MARSPAAVTARASAAARPGAAVGATTQTCPRVTLEIGVFFDGTGNNAANAGRGPEGSYANARSNVALLSRLYKDNARFWERNACGGFERKFARIYVPGIGTIDGGQDSTLGQATGMGDYGVEARVHGACLEVGNKIRQLSPGVEPLEIVLDVFGFSRGAAAARYFVNCFRQGYVEYWRRYVEVKRAYLPKGRRVRIRYLGIFDTVAAIGLGTDERNGPVNVHLSSAQANRILHLTATNEYRTNFRLNHNLPGGGAARALPGAHSDVGGGYGKKGDLVKVRSGGTLLAETPQQARNLQAAFQRHAGPSREARQATWVNIGFLNAREPSHGYVDSGRITARQQRSFIGPPRTLYQVDAASYINRPWVELGLSRIPLRIMYNDAMRAGVPFLGFPDSGEYQIPEGLGTVGTKLIAGQGLTEAERRHTLRNYGHISAHHNSIGMAAGANYTRTVYPNQPGRAR